MRQIVVLLLFLQPLAAWSQQLPDGWRLPTEEELSGEERDNKHNAYQSKSRFSKAVGDFNGDGKEDVAYILISEKFNGDGLFIYLSGPEGFHWLNLEMDNWDESYPGKNYKYSRPDMGIGTLPEKIFRSYVAKALVTPTDIVPKEEDYSNPALDYFRFESAGSLFFWRKSESRFVRFWYSD